MVSVLSHILPLLCLTFYKLISEPLLNFKHLQLTRTRRDVTYEITWKRHICAMICNGNLWPHDEIWARISISFNIFLLQRRCTVNNEKLPWGANAQIRAQYHYTCLLNHCNQYLVLLRFNPGAPVTFASETFSPLFAAFVWGLVRAARLWLFILSH